MSKKFESFLETLGAIMIAMLFVTVIIQVFARVVISTPTTWTVEVGRALFLAVVFIVTPVVLNRNALMMINSLHDMTKGRGRLILDLINDLLIDLILIAMAFAAWERTVEMWKVEIPTIEWMKSGYLYLVMFLGTLAMLFFSVRHTVNRFKKGN